MLLPPPTTAKEFIAFRKRAIREADMVEWWDQVKTSNWSRTYTSNHFTFESDHDFLGCSVVEIFKQTRSYCPLMMLRLVLRQAFDQLPDSEQVILKLKEDELD